ncbi:hypothetical protein PoB_005230200 [Plakobranchus ocellatus]|uniref:Uncharacterized protein n=1 Tax=Plakobranchus ocellatus TaxID=259542 RepID=A0AAV4C2G8_9GAST|nr:hypothetical protein PoB_005230200 [Plakobranchus ocellatus]
MSSAITQPTSSEIFKISVLDALYDMRSAWDKVREQPIKNCFHLSGFLKEAELESETAEDVPLALHEDTRELEQAIEALAAREFVKTSAQDFAAINSNIEITAEVSSVPEIVLSLQFQNEMKSPR